jgi:hypothetical protein
MKYIVTESFTISTPQGVATLPVGRVLTLTQDQADKLGSKVIAADEPSPKAPKYKAWLEGDHLHITGVVDDLEKVIIDLTADNLPLRDKLLRTHIDSYLKTHKAKVIEQARDLMRDLAHRDPGGRCWAWIQTNKPDLWKAHKTALHADDIDGIRHTFNSMLEEWEKEITAE